MLRVFILVIVLGAWSFYADAQHRKATQADTEAVFRDVAQMPSFRGDFNEYLLNNICVPDDDSIWSAGRIAVQFIVGRDGSIRDATILRSSGFSKLDAEVLRIIRTMPAWNPGINYGRAVSVYYKLPMQICFD